MKYYLFTQRSFNGIHFDDRNSGISRREYTEILNGSSFSVCVLFNLFRQIEIANVKGSALDILI